MSNSFHLTKDKEINKKNLYLSIPVSVIGRIIYPCFMNWRYSHWSSQRYPLVTTFYGPFWTFTHFKFQYWMDKIQFYNMTILYYGQLCGWAELKGEVKIFFFSKSFTFLAGKLLYNSIFPSVWNVLAKTLNFSDPIQDNFRRFLVKFRLTNEHLFYNYYVHLYVGKNYATYGRTCAYALRHIWLQKSVYVLAKLII